MSETNRRCPACGGTLVFSHEDDAYTRFFKCQKCGTIRSQRVTAEEIATYLRQAKAFRHENEDKPKPPQLTCGDCVAFHAPFCSFAYTDEPDLRTFTTDHACTRYFTRPLKSMSKARNETVAFQRFNRKVENL